MDKLPKLQPCPKCGKSPEWYSTWADPDRITFAICLACECKQRRKDVLTGKAVGYLGNLYLDHITNDLKSEWDAYCSTVNKESKFFMPKGEKK